MRDDAELARSAVGLAWLAFGIAKLRLDQHGGRLEQGLAYGAILGESARQELGMSLSEGLIAAIAEVNGGRFPGRILTDFRPTGVALVSPRKS